MGDAKHSPAPWRAVRMVHAETGEAMTAEEIGEYVANSVRVSGGPEFLAVVCEKADGPADVCLVGNGPDGPHNAALIASAPDLLAACEASSAVVEHEGRCAICAVLPGGCEASVQLRYRAAELRGAAIQKARGGHD